jgi:hypothetical protein
MAKLFEALAQTLDRVRPGAFDGRHLLGQPDAGVRGLPAAGQDVIANRDSASRQRVLPPASTDAKVSQGCPVC